jgi:hypothetical protein
MVGGEVDALDAEPATLEHPEPGTVEPLEHGVNLLTRENDGQPLGHFARTTPSSQGRSISSTSLYRNRRALSAWFWVEAATCPSTARDVRNFMTSGARISAGWRLSWKKMKRRIQATYASGAAAHVAGPQGPAEAVEEAGPRGRGRVALAERPRREAPAATRQRRVLGRAACLHDDHYLYAGLVEGQCTGPAGRAASLDSVLLTENGLFVRVTLLRVLEF